MPPSPVTPQPQPHSWRAVAASKQGPAAGTQQQQQQSLLTQDGAFPLLGGASPATPLAASSSSSSPPRGGPVATATPASSSGVDGPSPMAPSSGGLQQQQSWKSKVQQGQQGGSGTSPAGPVGSKPASSSAAVGANGHAPRGTAAGVAYSNGTGLARSQPGSNSQLSQMAAADAVSAALALLPGSRVNGTHALAGHASAPAGTLSVDPAAGALFRPRGAQPEAAGQMLHLLRGLQVRH